MFSSPDGAGHLTILLVEDSVGDAMAFKRSMARVNPDVVLKVVTSAEAALPFLETTAVAFGLCIFDINLPGASGLDLLAKVKPWHRALPMMMLSTSQSDTEINRAFASGADGYLVKPLDFGGFDAIARYICDCWFDGCLSDASRGVQVVLPTAV